MAVTQSPRLGLTRWSEAADPFRRAQLDADHDRIDDLAAIYGQGLYNDRPAAGIPGRLYHASDAPGGAPDGLVYYDTGAKWVLVGSPAPDLTPYARKDGATFTGDVVLAGARSTVGDADTDVLRNRAVELETHTRSVTNTYTDGKLTGVTEKAGATTVKTTTLTYTGDQLTTVTEVADGITVTTTLTYDGAGILTGTTRSVA